MLRAGQTLLTHDLDWRTRSGIAEKSSVGREHKFLSEVLHLMTGFDQVNSAATASGEALFRRLLQIEAA
eukprot:3139414-Lingulodinium_polyedra.AAC.1